MINPGLFKAVIVSFVVSLLAAALYSIAWTLLWRSMSTAPNERNRHPSRYRVADISPVRTSNTHLSQDGAFAASTQPNESPNKPTLGYQTNQQRNILLLATIALMLHSWVVIRQMGLPQGLLLPLFTSIAATTLTIVLLHIILCLRQPADYLGLVVYPLAAISLIASQVYGGGAPIVGDAVQMHVFLSLLAYAVLALAAAQAILVSIQRQFLSRHKPVGIIRALPALDTTERLLFTLLGLGFALLSLSLASGFFYLEDMFGQQLVHKTVLSCSGWVIFGVLLFGRWQFGWRGKKAVHWTLAGFAILILAYFGTKFVLEVLLR